jgi:hypothetical protein
MTDILRHLTRTARDEDGFVLGRVALVVVILAIILVAALIALIVPN